MSETNESLFQNSVLNYANKTKRFIVNQMKEMDLITIGPQAENNKPCFPNKSDINSIIKATITQKFLPFYDECETYKLFKYSVPFVYDIESTELLKQQIEKIKALKVDDLEIPKNSEFTADLIPYVYSDTDEEIFLKFVLQKNYYDSDSQEIIDYRYPIIICINLKHSFLDIRFDSVKYDPKFNKDSYEQLVLNCIDWLKINLSLRLFDLNHDRFRDVIKDKSDPTVRIYRQLMYLDTGAAAELTAPTSTEAVLPFIDELRELIDDNEDLFSQSPAIKDLLVNYIDETEANAHYQYLCVEWVFELISSNFIVKVIFDFYDNKHTVLQHFTSSGKDFGKGRMNNVLKYLFDKGAFVKGEEA